MTGYQPPAMTAPARSSGPTHKSQYYPKQQWPVRTWFWEIASEDIQNEAETLRTTIKTLSVDIAGAARGSSLIAEADIQDLRHNPRQMLANVRFNQCHHSGVYVHHDEGLVLGVDPSSQNESPVDIETEAQR